MRRAVLALVTLAAVLACAAPTAPTPPVSTQLGTDRRLFVIGDSVMVGALGAIVTGLPGWQVTVEAQVGLSLLGSASIIRQRRGEIGEFAVIELGANDGTDVEVFAQRVDAMMDALAGVPRVIWINQAAFEPGRSALNATLAAASSRHPTLDVVDWSSVVAAHPDYVSGDGLHLSAAGQQVLAGAIAQRLLVWIAESTTPPRSMFELVGPFIGAAVARVAATTPQ